MVEKLWKADAIWFGFLIAYFGGNLWCPWGYICIEKWFQIFVSGIGSALPKSEEKSLFSPKVALPSLVQIACSAGWY